jgi:hypothetical protein
MNHLTRAWRWLNSAWGTVLGGAFGGGIGGLAYTLTLSHPGHAGWRGWSIILPAVGGAVGASIGGWLRRW